MNDSIQMCAKLINKIRIKLIETPIYEFISSPVERILYSKQFIRRFDSIKSFPQEKRRISVAITHYERPELLIVTLKNIFRDERVSEIVILDDGSSLESFLKCTYYLKDFRDKVRLFRRDVNLGPFATKIQVSSLCSNSWCILLDSDNTIFDCYLNSIFNLKIWNEDIIYCPEYAFPHYNFKNFKNSIFDFNTVCNLQKKHQVFKDNYMFICLMNDGNCFLNNKVFTTVLKPYLELRPYAIDSILPNYIWLSNDKKIKVLEGAFYYHRIHPKSNWILNVEKGVIEYAIVIKKFEEEQRATVENLLLDFESIDAISQKIEHIPL